LPTGDGEIGIDLELNRLATCSDGTRIPALKHYRRYEAALAVAQRAKNKRRVAAIPAKITNARRHHLHEQSTRIARENRLIVVGNVSPSKLVKTRMAKSILDASWSMLRNQLRYKASRHGARYVEADERWTSQLCSDCGAVGGPKGIAQLGVRHWVALTAVRRTIAT
jgi:IS605 OrfB family transposase